MATEEYQEFRKRGFFITGLKWQATQNYEPFHRVIFDVDFLDGQRCRGFKYSVRYSPRLNGGNYAKGTRRMEDDDADKLYQLIELTARQILSNITAKDESE